MLLKETLRVGNGFDVHPLVKGRKLILGGVHINHDFGCDGHSDGDVLIHSICDALLGAANLGDIGKHFPDTLDQYKGIDSKVILEDVMALIRAEGYELGNLDSTICLQVPKIAPYISQMQKVLSRCMRVDVNQVSIKATTTERLSFVGKEEGVSAYATVLLQKA